MAESTFEIPSLDGFGAPFFFFASDANAQITYLSDSVEDVLGYSPEEHTGKHFVDFLVPGHDLNTGLGECQKSRFRGQERTQVLRAVRDRDGRERLLAIQTYGHVDEQGRIVRSHGVAQDVTAFVRHYHVVKEKLERIKKTKAELDDRERRVLALITDGRLNKQIAVELGVSERTIEGTRSRIMRKLGANHVADLIALETEVRLLSNLLEPMEEHLGFGFDPVPFPAAASTTPPTPQPVDQVG